MAVRQDSERSLTIDEETNHDEQPRAMSQSGSSRGRHRASTTSLSGKGGKTFSRRLRRAFSRKDSSRRDGKENDKIKELEQQLAHERKENEDMIKVIEFLKSQLSEMVHTNSYYVTIEVDDANIQVGDSNVQRVSASSGLESTINEVERLLKSLTTGVDENIQKRAECEQELRTVEIQLKELTGSIEQLQRRCEDYTVGDEGRMLNLKRMLDALTRDRSDQAVLTECVESLNDLTKRRIVDSFDALPAEARAGIIRLVYKFEDITWKEFAAALKVKTANIKHVATTDGPLDNENCTSIMLEWIAATSGEPETLLHVVRALEKRCQQDMVQSMQEKTTGSKNIDSAISRSSMYSEDLSETSTESTEPVNSRGMKKFKSQMFHDNQTQQVHILELCRTTLDMEGKVNEMYDFMLLQKKHFTKKKQNN